MELICIDIVVFLLLIYVNYRKYRFSFDFNIKQNTGLATIFFVLVMYGITMPFIPTFILSSFDIKPDPTILYDTYIQFRFKIYWILGVVQLIYLFMINSRIKSKQL